MKTYFRQPAHKNTTQTHRTYEKEKKKREKLKRIKHKHIYTKKLSRILTV